MQPHFVLSRSIVFRYLRIGLILLSPLLINACGGGGGDTAVSTDSQNRATPSAVRLDKTLGGFMSVGTPTGGQIIVSALDKSDSVVGYQIQNPTVGGGTASIGNDGIVQWTPNSLDVNTTELKLSVLMKQGTAQTLRLPVNVRASTPLFETTLLPEQSVYSDAEGIVSLRAETFDGSSLSGKLTVVQYSDREGVLSYQATADNEKVRVVFLEFPTVRAIAGGLRTQSVDAADGLMADQTSKLIGYGSGQFIYDRSCGSVNYLLVTTRLDDVSNEKYPTCNSSGAIFQTRTAERRPAIQIDATCNGIDVQCSKMANPIILVHGFNPYEAITGGGSDTWGKLAHELSQSSMGGNAQHEVFDFRWTTYMRFEEAAGQLALLVSKIATITGKKPIVVAHSFGGVVSHLALSGQGVIWRNSAKTSPPDISGVVQRLVTLGSPVGGISATANVSETFDGTSHTFLQGRDAGDVTIIFCEAVTCIQAGAFDLIQTGYKQNKLAMWADLPSAASASDVEAAYKKSITFGDKSYLTTGESIIRLKRKTHDVPTSIVVGVSSEEYVLSTTKLPSLGDGLISVEGQMYPTDVFGATSLESIAKGSPERMFNNKGGNKREYFYLPGGTHTSVQGKTVSYDILEASFDTDSVDYCIERLYGLTGCEKHAVSKQHLWTMNSAPYTGSGQIGLLRESGSIPDTIKPRTWKSTINVLSPCPFPRICTQSNDAVAILPLTIELRRKDTGMRVSSARFYTDAAGKVEPDLNTFIDTTAGNFNRADHQIRITLGDGVTYEIKNVVVDDLTADVVQVPDIVLQRKGATGTGTIYGRVIDKSNRPVANVQVRLVAGVNLGASDFANVAPSTTARIVITDANGNFAVSGLRATEFTVRLTNVGIFNTLQGGVVIPNGSSISKDFVVTAKSCTTGTLQNGGCGAPSNPQPVGTFNYTGGDSYPLRANFTIDSTGLINGGEYDFHKLDGTMTPCMYSLANAATCHGASTNFSITSQSSLFTLNGAVGTVTLKAGPDDYGFIFNGTITGKTWSGTWTNATNSGSGTFSVEVGLSVNGGPGTGPYLGNIQPLAFNFQSATVNTFNAALSICIPKSADYDNVTVIGLGLPGSGVKLVSGPYSSDCLSLVNNVAGQEIATSTSVYVLPPDLAPNTIPAGSTYLIRKYNGQTFVGSYQLYTNANVIAPSEMTAAMFPTLTLTTYAQLCPGGNSIGNGSNLPTWWSMPVAQVSQPDRANVNCNGTSALADIQVKDSFGRAFDMLRQVDR